MKSRLIVSLAAVFSLSIGSLAVAAESKPKPGVVEARSATVTGTVENIDYKTRMVTLKDDKGHTATMEVGPEVVRLGEVKKGDKVKMDYLESVAVVVASPHESISSGEASGKVIVRNKTKDPSGTAIETHVATAMVEKIDAKKRTAVLKTPDGQMMEVEIAPDVQHVENVKKGDQVLVKYTQALAVTVSKP
jgi:hypothetical protein